MYFRKQIVVDNGVTLHDIENNGITLCNIEM